ncbi:hypothetical protein EDB84DRAFT_336033 [Lactarius hengduanensis]|nr:hypothetical protein EDB84DRAFT_336033 [Lactarius hengduanensis]
MVACIPSSHWRQGPRIRVATRSSDAAATSSHTIFLSACDACQGAEAFAWSVYSTECTNTPTFLTFPNPVPLGTSVPQWALMDSILKDFWNSTEAYLIHQNAAPDLEPGSSVSASDSGSVNPTSSTSSSEASHISSTSSSEISPTSSTSSSGGSSPPSSPESGSNTAAIAGIIAGGVVALAAIQALLVLYLLWKRRRSQAPSAAVDGGTPPMSQEHPPLSGDETYVPGMPMAPMKSYDPNDQSTFPEFQGVPTSTAFLPSNLSLFVRPLGREGA